MNNNDSNENELDSGCHPDGSESHPCDAGLDAEVRRCLDALVLGKRGECEMSLFMSRSMRRYWIHPAHGVSRGELSRRRRSIVKALSSTEAGRKCLYDGFLKIWNEPMGSSWRRDLLCIARTMSTLYPSVWAIRMWRLLGDTYCLFSTLDAPLVSRELECHGDDVSPVGSFQLLEGDDECVRLFFRVGFAYYSHSSADWDRYCRLLERRPWVWSLVLTLDMSDGMLRSMMEYIYRTPPLWRHPDAVRFMDDNRDELLRRLGVHGYLAGSPEDFWNLDAEELRRTPVDILLSSGAAGYCKVSRGMFPCRLGVVVSVREQRARVLCSDTLGTETRQVLFEDMDPGTPVMMWRDGVMAVRRYDEDIGRLFEDLRGRSPSPGVREDVRYRYPVFEYRDMVAEELSSRTRAEQSSLVPGRSAILDAMWRMSPRDFASRLLAEGDFGITDG